MSPTRVVVPSSSLRSAPMSPDQPLEPTRGVPSMRTGATWERARGGSVHFVCERRDMAAMKATKSSQEGHVHSRDLKAIALHLKAVLIVTLPTSRELIVSEGDLNWYHPSTKSSRICAIVRIGVCVGHRMPAEEGH